MTIESIITDALCTYTGLPEFCIVERSDYWYSCLFEDGIRVDFKVKTMPLKDTANTIAMSIHKSYLQQSHEDGMACK